MEHCCEAAKYADECSILQSQNVNLDPATAGVRLNKKYTQQHGDTPGLPIKTKLSGQASVREACTKNKMRDLEGVLPHDLRS